MDRFRGPLLAGLLVLVAFTWGYKREEIARGWNSLFSSAKEEPTVATVETTAAEQPNLAETIPVNETPSPLPIAKKPSTADDALEFYRTFSRPPAGNVNSQTLPKSGALANDGLQSLQSGKVEGKKERKRNLYFEQLSQELKELQGQKPSDIQVPPAEGRNPEAEQKRFEPAADLQQPPTPPAPSPVGRDPVLPETEPVPDEREIPETNGEPDINEMPFEPSELDSLNSDDLTELERTLDEIEAQ